MTVASRRRKIGRASFASLACLCAAATAQAREPAQEPIVTIEQMQLASGPIRLALPKNTTRRTNTMQTVVVLSQVATDGSVLQSTIHQSSGSPHVDEAALLAMRNVSFRPYRADGVAQAVTVVIPMHIAAEDLPRRR